MSTAARETLVLETERKVGYVESLATRNYRINEVTSVLASGFFKTDGMVVIPCSMKPLAGISVGYADNLLIRAALVTLKERRPLILVPRETPLTIIDLRNMVEASEAGAVILPAMPGFYHRPKSIEDLVNHLVGKVLDVLGLEHNMYKKWREPNPSSRFPALIALPCAPWDVFQTEIAYPCLGIGWKTSPSEG